MRRRLRSPAGRAALTGLCAALAAALAIGAASAEAGDGITATGASVDKVGWWHSRNMATSTPAANVTVPPPPGVPAGTLAVGAVNGEPDRIAAIGILPDAAVGDTVTAFTLTIKEAGPPAAGFNGSAAKILACPITAFWVGGENGTWDTRPSYDCDLAKAAGSRADDGTWTFDLAPIGAAWLDPAGTIAPDGVVLVEDVDSPDGFQTVFATSGAGAIVVSLTYVPGADTTDTTIADPGDTGDFGGTDGFESPSFGSGAIPVGGLPSPQVASPEAGTTPQDAPPVAPRTIARVRPNILGNMPGGVALVAPTFLLLLGLLAYSLGPAGEPAGIARQRGVSRALAARARAASDHRRPPSPPEVL